VIKNKVFAPYLHCSGSVPLDSEHYHGNWLEEGFYLGGKLLLEDSSVAKYNLEET
jgi:hypothetical protein